MGTVAANEKPHLVVVDDEVQVLRAIEDQLEDRYEVHAVTNALDALALLRSLKEVSVLLSDQRMPEMAGDELFARAAELSGATQVLISGFADLDAVVRAVNKGRVFGYVSKPWDEQALRLTIHRAEEHHRLVRDLQRLRTAMDGSLDTIYLTDVATLRFVYVNDAACRRLGYDREKLLRMGPQDVLNEGAESVLREYDAVIAAGERGTSTESRFTRSDGSEGWTEIHRRAAEIDAAWMVVSTGRDITERKRAEERVARLTRMHAMLSGINEAIVRVRSREDLYRETCRLAVEVGGFRLVYIRMLSGDGATLEPAESFGPQGLEIEPVALAAPGENGAQMITALRAFLERRTQVNNDLVSDPLRTTLRRQAIRSGILSVASVPLTSGARAVGVLTLAAGEVNFFDEEEIRLAEALAGDVSFALESMQTRDELSFLALRDPLTRLANAALFSERLSQQLGGAAQRGGRLALAVLDIERLTHVNESFGRQAGDALLRETGERICRHGGDESLVARLGGDHFAVIVAEFAGRDDLMRRVERRQAQIFGAPFRVGGTELRIAARAGIAVFPDDGTRPETLLQNAEAALKAAKRQGNRQLCYERRMTDRAAERLTLENQLREAIEKNEFILHYQAKLAVRTQRVVGAEALIRWQNPSLGLVPPARFIPLMEETGLVMQAGIWALQRAAADQRSWAEAGLGQARVSVNIPPILLHRPDFAAIVRESIREGTTPAAIDLEIKESLATDDVESNAERIRSVRALGLEVAIDGFGTGYASLVHIARLPVSSVKIDGSFIGAMLASAEKLSLVRTIISLAHVLGLKVVAEGVEDAEQAKYLRLLGCDEMQGFLYGKAVPAHEFAALLGRQEIEPEGAS